jgi:hypothetical protein
MKPASLRPRLRPARTTTPHRSLPPGASASTMQVGAGRSMPRGVIWIVVIVLAAVTASCTSDTQTTSAPTPPQSPAPSVSTSPTPIAKRPHKPVADNGRLNGTYVVKYTLISSDIPESNRVEQNRWRIHARCKEGGSCNARVESLTNNWKATAIWRRGNYRWARTIKKSYTCGSPGNVDYYIDATYEYSINGERVRWNGTNWVIASFSGTFTSKGLRGCGLSGPPEEKYAIQGKLA